MSSVCSYERASVWAKPRVGQAHTLWDWLLLRVPRYMMISIRLLLLCTLFSRLSARCPSPQTLPTKTRGGRSMCGRIYEHSDRDPNASCGGQYLDVYNGEATGVVPLGWNDEVSSIVTRNGCTLRGYIDGKFEGSVRSFRGVTPRLKDVSYGFLGLSNWNDEISSYSCSCEFEPIDCQASDSWELALSCDATGHSLPSTCTHQLKEGIVIGKSVTKGGSVSSSVSATITSELQANFEIISSGLSSSITSTLTNEYNWSESSSSLKSIQTIKTVEMTAEPGKITRLYQIVGRCGDTVVYTEKYKIVSD